MNERVKSSDLIGILPVMIGGSKIGIFFAVECKEKGWTFRESDKRAVAQKAFIDIVCANGGLAGFVTCVEDFHKLIEPYRPFMF